MESLLATFLGVLRRAQPPSCLGSERVGLPRRRPPRCRSARCGSPLSALATFLHVLGTTPWPDRGVWSSGGPYLASNGGNHINVRCPQHMTPSPCSAINPPVHVGSGERRKRCTPSWLLLLRGVCREFRVLRDLGRMCLPVHTSRLDRLSQIDLHILQRILQRDELGAQHCWKGVCHGSANTS